MDIEKYKILSTIFNKLTIVDKEKKETHFKQICGLMVDNSDITTDNINDFILIDEISKDDLYQRLYSEENIGHEIIFFILTKYCLLKYEEKTAFRIVELLLPIYQYHVNEYNEYEDMDDDDVNEAYIEILKLKIKSEDFEISTSANIKLIKYKRQNTQHNDGEDGEDVEYDNSDDYKLNNNDLYSLMMGKFNRGTNNGFR